MNKIVGVKFRNNGKVYDFDSGHFVLKKGDKVMVITEEGPAIGCVCTDPQNRSPRDTNRPLKKIFRLATDEEVRRYEEGIKTEQEVYRYCYQRVREREIPMSLVGVERRFDGSKIVVYFTAEGRVDFRELVKDLVKRFRTRIEMRQIGVRHQAKMVGGLGTCGRPLCCATFIHSFEPVTIKMAKEQNLSLNPSKISGMCGRLMCCLAFEEDFYKEAKKEMPKVGKRIQTKFGEGKVVRQNALKRTVTVLLESGAETEVDVADIKLENNKKDKERR
ncbi:MAG: stage 0 sporulation protein [Deltaproteobacteria bacterium]|nr:MAG: stage 0 sporulation protein [Deltaproteobacteria bacterium]